MKLILQAITTTGEKKLDQKLRRWFGKYSLIIQSWTPLLMHSSLKTGNFLKILMIKEK
jgi:hypothetical protein